MSSLYNIDWTKSMQQTFEFYKVDANTWDDMELLDYIESCSIERDLEADTLGSASFVTSDSISECYVRVYMKVIQNGITERVCLGTFLVQAPSLSFNGKKKSIDVDGYTPLIEFKGSSPPLGYSVLKDTNIKETAFNLCYEYGRAPVIYSTEYDASTQPTAATWNNGVGWYLFNGAIYIEQSGQTLDLSKKYFKLPQDSHKLQENFIANTDDTWFSFINDMLANADMYLSLNDRGEVIFEKNIEMASMSPVWVFNDDNSSILLPDITDENDLYDVPNVVEVLYSTTGYFFYSKVINDDVNSPISTVNRGREILHRDTSPSLTGTPDQTYVDEYAKSLLKSLSCLQHEVTFSHAYCPVKIGDCVLLNYEASGIKNIKAKVISQSIDCSTGCTVEATAVYTTNLWG